MDIITVLFYVFAIITVGSAAMVAFSKSMMYSAFSLLFTLLGVAGLYVLLMGDFLAVTQLMIYVGGILVLIIFAVMLTTNIDEMEIKKGFTGKGTYMLAGLVGAVILITLGLVFANTQWVSLPVKPEVGNAGTIDSIGKMLMGEYLIAFEVAAILLLIAIVGAAKIARRK
jgi:NADH:ubiquinone oxidoreductase subunit 6 (subunit J)